jgi:hypothetical protein
MKKKRIFKALVIFCPFISLAQISKDSETVRDTVPYYSIRYTIKRSGDSTSYFVNDQRVSEKDWQKYKISLQRKKTCNPCYLKELNVDGVLQSSCVFYYKCPGEKEETTEHRTYGKE